MSEYKFIFTGTPGCGKTTAISTISDTPPLTTGTYLSNNELKSGEANNAAMDFGEISLEEAESIHLYGTPGQERFRFMWDVIVRGSLGMVILVDHSRPSPLTDLDIYLENFSTVIKETSAVIAVTRMDLAVDRDNEIDSYYEHLLQKDIAIPVLPTDVRNKTDVILLLNNLMTIIEYK